MSSAGTLGSGGHSVSDSAASASRRSNTVIGWTTLRISWKPSGLRPNTSRTRLSFAGASGQDVAAGLMPPEGDVVGVLGGPVLAHFRLRFDFPAGRLDLSPAS